MRSLFATLLLFCLSLMAAGAWTKLDNSSHALDKGQGQTTADELAEASRLNEEVVKLYKEGKYDKALPLAKRVLEIREKALGADHQLIASALINLAAILISKDRYDDAGQLLQRAVAIMEKSLGPMHHDVGKLLEKYACLLWARGKRAEADKVEKRIGRILYQTKDALEFDDLVKSKAIKLPQPGYPEEARRAGFGGTIVVWIKIDETGKVVEAAGRCGAPALVKVSEEAAFQARFTPTLVAGKPTAVRAYVTYNFVIK